MTLDIRFRYLNNQVWFRRRVRDDLQSLSKRVSIEDATIVVEPVQEGSDALQMRVHLAVPGPDLIATASDYTLPAVWTKARKALERQLNHRETKRLARERRRSPRMANSVAV